VVGDAAATLERSAPHLPRIRDLGYPAALVAQDGLELLEVPWRSFDALFIGGTTEWKLGEHVAPLVAEAKARGMHVHMGRVNSRKRWRIAKALGCDTADGTFLAFAPRTNIPRFRMWLEEETSA
jgi:cobyric acid synthase